MKSLTIALIAALPLVANAETQVSPGLSAATVMESAPVVHLTGANSGLNGGDDKNREKLSVSVVDGDKSIAARCVLTNEHGDWSVSTPDTVNIRRSDSDLQVKCSAAGYVPVKATLKAVSISIPRPHFHFSTDSGGDGEDSASVDDDIKVPAYPANITLNASRISATASSN